MNENNERISIPRIIPCENIAKNARIKVVGVGGAGGNAVNRMVKMDIPGVEFIAVNTDALALENSKADEKISIGQKTTKSLGAGAKPNVGREAILEDRERVSEMLKGADLVFITAGMGGGTGTGAAPVVAEIARELDILTVAVVSMPFRWEGPVRKRHAKNGANTLREAADTIIVIDNQRVEKVIDAGTTIEQAFGLVDEVLGNAVRAVCDIFLRHGNIHVDFADIRTIMTNGGDALMGTGIAEGEDRAIRAAENAINCPLLHDVSISGATGVLVNISHGENFTMHECSAAMDFIYESVGEANDPNIIFGDITIPELGDQVSITVIATGFGDAPERITAMPGYSAAAPVPATTSAPAAAPAPEPQTQQGSTVHFADLAKGFTPYQNPGLDVRKPYVEEDVFARPAAMSAKAQAEMAPAGEIDSAVDYDVPSIFRNLNKKETETGETRFRREDDSSVDYRVPTLLREEMNRGEIY
ncbi:MAG: cell division protein FtsZ [Fibrobacter sp.]|jgi:cell division protein FtsZ|nr:cell division protein FtsZ [Fibrobacter sp.]